MNTMKMVQRVSSSKGFARVAPYVVPALDRAVHRVTRGKKMLSDQMLPSLILTMTGARSGRIRRTPLACVPERDGETWLLVGSNFGKPDHPAWTANLRHHPEAEISWRGAEIPVRARELEGEEREEAWCAALAFWPPWANYQARIERRIRLFRLERR